MKYSTDYDKLVRTKKRLLIGKSRFITINL